MYNFIYSSSNQYAPYAITSMTSLLQNNRDLYDVHFYILSNDISSENRKKIEGLCQKYGADMEIIDCVPVIKEIMGGGARLNFNPSSFLRIYIPQILPTLDKALFIDSDTYIEAGIQALYETDISSYLCAMSYNMPIYKELLQEVGMDEKDGYYNAGIMLLNLKAWREENISRKIQDFFYANGSNFVTDDQSVINAIVADKTKTLEYKYNAMIGTFYWSYKKFCKINTDIGKKAKAEFDMAKRYPVVVHFNGPGVRAWEKMCGHPYTRKYRKILIQANPDYKILYPPISKKKLIMQYVKHVVIDHIENWINR